MDPSRNSGHYFDVYIVYIDTNAHAECTFQFSYDSPMALARQGQASLAAVSCRQLGKVGGGGGLVERRPKVGVSQVQPGGSYLAASVVFWLLYWKFRQQVPFCEPCLHSSLTHSGLICVKPGELGSLWCSMPSFCPRSAAASLKLHVRSSWHCAFWEWQVRTPVCSAPKNIVIVVYVAEPRRPRSPCGLL